MRDLPLVPLASFPDLDRAPFRSDGPDMPLDLDRPTDEPNAEVGDGTSTRISPSILLRLREDRPDWLRAPAAAKREETGSLSDRSAFQRGTTWGVADRSEPEEGLRARRRLTPMSAPVRGAGGAVGGGDKASSAGSALAGSDARPKTAAVGDPSNTSEMEEGDGEALSGAGGLTVAMVNVAAVDVSSWGVLLSRTTARASPEDHAWSFKISFHLGSRELRDTVEASR